MEMILIILMAFALLLLAIVVELPVLDVTYKRDELNENSGFNRAALFSVIALFIFCCSGLQAQTKRSDDFRAKYELKEVVVMSRHNIRSPLASGGAAYMRVTPNKWFSWSSPGSQLSLRGGVLETEMGQFFRKWVVSEGLLPDNYRPDGDEVLWYTGYKQFPRHRS